MHFGKFSFGALQIGGSTYDQDVVIDRGEIRKRKKMPSKKFRDEFGHAPLYLELVIVPTREAIRLIERKSAANAILHVTC